MSDLADIVLPMDGRTESAEHLDIGEATVYLSSGQSIDASDVEVLPHALLKVTLTERWQVAGADCDSVRIAYYPPGVWHSVEPPPAGTLLAHSRLADTPDKKHVHVVASAVTQAAAHQAAVDWVASRWANDGPPPDVDFDKLLELGRATVKFQMVWPNGHTKPLADRTRSVYT